MCPDRALEQAEEFPLHQSPTQCYVYARKFSESALFGDVYFDYIAVATQVCVYGEKGKKFRSVA